jgi:hypothetical protein
VELELEQDLEGALPRLTAFSHGPGAGAQRRPASLITFRVSTREKAAS